MNPNIITALNSVSLVQDVEDTDTTRIYVAYPTVYTPALCITLTMMPSAWAIKTVATILHAQLTKQEDLSTGEIAARIVAGLSTLGMAIGDAVRCDVEPLHYTDMSDVSGMVCEYMSEATATDGQYNPFVTLYDNGTPVWADYVGFIFTS